MIFLYLILSILAFTAYGIDKSCAVSQKSRISEKALHLMAVLGGWPGAYIGQKVFRHKTQKQPFKLIFWLTVVINIIAACSIALHYPVF